MVFRVNYLLMVYGPLLRYDQLCTLTDLYLAALGHYQRGVRLAEQQLIHLTLRMVDALASPVPRLRKRLLALVDGEQPKELPEISDPDILLLPAPINLMTTRKDFLDLDKTDPQALKNFAWELNLQRGSRPIKICQTDIAEFLYSLSRALVPEGAHPQAVIDPADQPLVENMVALARQLITSTRSYCGQQISHIATDLQRAAEAVPAFFPIKRNLWGKLKEVMGYPQDHRWRLDLDRGPSRTNKDYRQFFAGVRSCATPDQLTETLVEDFQHRPLEFMYHIICVWTMAQEQQDELIDIIGVTHYQREEVKTAKRGEILSKIIRQQFDKRLWTMLTKVPASKPGPYSHFAVRLIAVHHAFQGQCTDDVLETLFKKLTKRSDPEIWYYYYLWLKDQNRADEASACLRTGGKNGSHMCLLQLGDYARLAKSYGQARQYYQQIKPTTEQVTSYGEAQYQLGELHGELQTLSKTACEQAYQYWLTACHYHHPLAVCRLFTCLYPDPNRSDNKWCPDPESRWRGHALLTDALELPSLSPHAGRELCRQLMHWHDTRTFDLKKLAGAWERLIDQEVLILAQLPACCWPDSCQAQLPELRQKAVEIICQHRQEPGQHGSEVVTCIAIRALSYYQDIVEQIQVSPPEMTVAGQRDDTPPLVVPPVLSASTQERVELESAQERVEQPEQPKQPEQPELLSVEEPQTGGEPKATAQVSTDDQPQAVAEVAPDDQAQARAEPGKHLQQALLTKNNVTIRATVKRLYQVHGDDLLHCLDTKQQMVRASAWLFYDGHSELALELLRKGGKAHRKAHTLLNRLKESTDPKAKGRTTEIVIKELSEHVDWAAQRLEDSQLETITELFFKGAFRGQSPRHCARVVTQLIARVPRYWQRRLLQEVNAGQDLSHLAQLAGSSSPKPGDYTHVLALLDRCAPYAEIALMKASIGLSELPLDYRKALADRLPEKELETLDASTLQQLATLAMAQRKPGTYLVILKKQRPQYAYELLADQELLQKMEAISYNTHLAALWQVAPPNQEYLPSLVANYEAYVRRTCSSLASKNAVIRKIPQLIKNADLIGLSMAMERLKEHEPNIERHDKEYFAGLIEQRRKFIEHHAAAPGTKDHQQAIQTYYAQRLMASGSPDLLL